VDRGEIREDVDGEIVLDLIYGPMIFRLLAGHGSLGEQESEAVVEAVFGGLRRRHEERSTSMKPASVAAKRGTNLTGA
jgi:hypothetical protein